MGRILTYNNEKEQQELLGIAQLDKKYQENAYSNEIYKKSQPIVLKRLELLVELQNKYQEESKQKNISKKHIKYLQNNLNSIEDIMHKYSQFLNKSIVLQNDICGYIYNYVIAYEKYHKEFNSMQRKIKNQDLLNSDSYKIFLKASIVLSANNIDETMFKDYLASLIRQKKIKCSESKINKYFNEIKNNMFKYRNFIRENTKFNSLEEIAEFQEYITAIPCKQLEVIEFLKNIDLLYTTYMHQQNINSLSKMEFLYNFENNNYKTIIKQKPKIILKKTSKKAMNKMYLNTINYNVNLIKFLVNEKKFLETFENQNSRSKIFSLQTQINELIIQTQDLTNNKLSLTTLSKDEIRALLNTNAELIELNKQQKQAQANKWKNNKTLISFKKNEHLINLFNTKIQQIVANTHLTNENLEELFILNIFIEQIKLNNDRLIEKNTTISLKNTLIQLNNKLNKSIYNCKSLIKNVSNLQIVSKDKLEEILQRFENNELSLDAIIQDSKLTNRITNVNHINVNNCSYYNLNQYIEKQKPQTVFKNINSNFNVDFTNNIKNKLNEKIVERTEKIHTTKNIFTKIKYNYLLLKAKNNLKSLEQVNNELNLREEKQI